MKRLIYIGAIFSVALLSCDSEKKVNYEKEQTKATEQIMNEAMRQVGMPNIRNFWQRKLMKMIYEIADQSNVVTYAYTFNQMTGKFLYIGRAVGFGVPFSAQYTNPMRIVDDPFGNWDAGGKVIPQPDPNGLYMPTSSSATWIILIDEDGKFNLVYMEPLLTVSQKPLPASVVENYPPDFWEKYRSGKHQLTRQEIEAGIRSMKESMR